VAMHIYTAPPPLRHLDPAAPAELEAYLNRLLAKLPAERPSMAHVAEELIFLGSKGSGALLALTVAPLPPPPPDGPILRRLRAPRTATASGWRSPRPPRAGAGRRRSVGGGGAAGAGASAGAGQAPLQRADGGGDHRGRLGAAGHVVDPPPGDGPRASRPTAEPLPGEPPAWPRCPRSRTGRTSGPRAPAARRR